MRKGFTLIELLIVIIIVGVLASVALPQYQRSAERGRSTVGLAALRQAADKLNAWYIQQDSYPTEQQFDTITFELVGVGANDLFSSLAYARSSTQEAELTLTRNPTSGWTYVLEVTLGGGEISELTCTGADCQQLGLDNL